MPELNFNALIPRQDFFQGYSEGQQQQNLLAQQAQARQLGDIQIKNAMREQQNAEAEAEAVKGASTLEEMANRYRAAGLGKQALATEAAISKQKTDRLTQAKTQHELIKGAANRVFANPEAAQQILMNFSRQTGIDVADDLAQIESLGGDPAKVKQWASGIVIEADKLTPKFHSLTIPGKGVQTGTTDISGKFTPGELFSEQMSEYQKAQNRNAAARLEFDQNKFAWEKANPGYEIREDADGNTVGVNKRTLQAFPVMIGGGGAPAAAPAVQGAGMPGPRVAQPGVVQAIPGMTSVLDQAAPAAAPATVASAPRQLVGKGTAMTENQSKSAMFGAAMNQANGIISKVEKEGTTTAPVAVSVLQGLARLSPQFLGTGENAANAIESVFRQDPTSLLGPDVNQQKLGQAQIAFATAYLRATSGASFGPSEVSNTIKEYFPLIGEDKAVVKQKAEARQRAIEGMKISTSKQGQSYIDQSGANANDPLGILGGKR